MKDLLDFGVRGKLPARYRLGGISGNGRNSVPRRIVEEGRDGSLEERRGFDNSLRGRVNGSSMSECDYSTATKFEWECLMEGRQDGDEYRCNMSMNEHKGNRFQEFSAREDVFRENVNSRHDVGQTVSPHLVYGGLHLQEKTGYSGLCGAEKMAAGEGLQKEELTRQGKYSCEEGKHGLYSAQDSCLTVPAPSQYRFSKPPSFGKGPCRKGNSENSRAERVSLGGFSQEDIGPGCQTDYFPLPVPSQHQSQSGIPSPRSNSKQLENSEQSLVKGYKEGNADCQKSVIREDKVGISSVNDPHRMILSPYISQPKAEVPLSTVYVSEEGECSLIRKSPAAENIADRKNHNINDGTRNYSDYVHSYMMPSPESKSKTLTPQVFTSPDKKHAFMSKQAVAENTGIERYFNEKDGPSYHTVGLHHLISPSPSKLEADAMPSVSVSDIGGPIAKSVIRLLPKPQRCPRSRTPLHSYSPLHDTQLSHESTMRSKELHINDSDQVMHVSHCSKDKYCTGDQNCAYFDEDVRSHYNIRADELHEKLSSTSKDYGPDDMLGVRVLNQVNSHGHSHEPNLKSSMLLQHHQTSQEQDFPIHPHANVVPDHLNQDLEVLHHYRQPHDVKTAAHYREDWHRQAYDFRQDKFNQLDTNHYAYLMDRDSYIDNRQRNASNPGNCHCSSCCNSCLHRNTRALLRGRYGRDNSSTFNKTYFKRQEGISKQVGENEDDGYELLANGDLQCQMLMKRSADLQNKDFTGVCDDASENTIDFEYNLPLKKLPLRMRLGEPNKVAARDIKKRLGPCTQISLSKLPKKHKSSNPPALIYDAQEPSQGHNSEPSASKVTSELSEHSHKFKEQVNRAFLESLKHLFESSAHQRKFMRLDKAESLKCDLCGSSREFKDTLSLAKHAFSYVKMDLRAQHLGLHKALSVLMGWNSNLAPNCPANLLDLSELEHSSLKEDLIIWPPVIIVHNSSVGIKDLRKQKIITVGKLESILEGMGFGGNSHKVHVGNDQGIMVVRFSATLSGLQAALELHKYYAKNKHGREELQHLNQNVERGDHEESEKAMSKVEDVLYGYLGTVEDLAKLDTQIKKWSLIKSKKDLLATAP